MLAPQELAKAKKERMRVREVTLAFKDPEKIRTEIMRYKNAQEAGRLDNPGKK